ncbi:hypothetical protein CLV00_2306 [Flavobacterium sp. 11]|jgi:hypothetical protein|nr:hypothetical protein CLV00_2306 [Flavobacterium sp. 11]
MEKDMDYRNSKLTPERALHMLRSEGLDVTFEQVQEILYLLRKIANIAVSKHLSERR